jgi:hypothetical protein
MTSDYYFCFANIFAKKLGLLLGKKNLRKNSQNLQLFTVCLACPWDESDELSLHSD